MRRPQGYLKISDPEGPGVEQDSFSCGHCQKVSFVKPTPFGVGLHVVAGGISLGNPAPQLLGGLCKVCMRLMCPACTAKREAGGDCIPFEKALALEESRNAFLKSMEQ